MPLSFSTGASKALGFTGSTTVLPSGAVYSFVNSPFGGGSVYNPMVAVPPVLLETSNNMSAQSFVFYVHGAGAGEGYVGGRPLFWSIKHITTTAMDFSATSGTFTSSNWGLSVYNPGSWYNNPYGEELARFGIEAIAENVTEGTETFQVEIREASFSGPVVLTSPVISLADTSAPATFTFDTAWNDAISQGGLTEGNTYEFRVNGTNLSTGEEYPVIAPDGWRTYYTIDGKPLNYNYPDSQYYTWAYNQYEGNVYAQQLLPAMHIYVKNAEYLDNVPRPGYGSPTNTTRKETYGSGRFYISPRNDGVTEGPTTHTIQLRTSPMNADYTGGATIATYTFTINDYVDVSYVIFGYGSNGNSFLSITNLVSSTGVVATDTAGVGTARIGLAAAGYGTDKAIFGYGYSNYGLESITNLVSNTGVVSTDTAGVGTARYNLAAAGYGTDKAIFGFGAVGQVSGAYLSMTNLVSNTGVVANDTAGVGQTRDDLAAAGYGGDKAIFGFGGDNSTINYTNLVSNTGVVAYDGFGVGTSRRQLAAASYGTDKAIFGYGNTGTKNTVVATSITNLVSNTGVLASDTTGVGTARRNLAAAKYGADKAIFGYGDISGYGSFLSITNLVSNTGVVATDTAGVGTARGNLAAGSFG